VGKASADIVKTQKNKTTNRDVHYFRVTAHTSQTSHIGAKSMVK